jgi:hypothetical protein
MNWWWVWITFTTAVLGAHSVAEGVSLSCYGLLVTMLLMTAPVSGMLAVTRAWVLILGLYLAFVLLIALEIYLGGTGLYYGPIGATKRPFKDFDDALVDYLLILYRYADIWKALASQGLALLIFIPCVHVFKDKYINIFGHAAAGIGMFVAIFFWLPFTNALEDEHIAFTEAALAASGAKKTLGSYRERVNKFSREVVALRQLLAVLQSPENPANKELLERIRTYARVLLAASKTGSERNALLRRPGNQYQPRPYLQPLRPPLRYPVQPDEAFSPQKGDGVKDPHLTGLDMANRQRLEEEQAELLDQGNALRRERDQLLLQIRRIVGNEIMEALKGEWDQDLADEVILGIIQTIAALEAGEALLALDRKLAELQIALDERQNQNMDLGNRIESYEQQLVHVAANDNWCSDVIAELTAYLGTPRGRELIRLVNSNPGRAKELLDPQRVQGPEERRPPSPDNALNEPAVVQEVALRLRELGISSPEHSWSEFQRILDSQPGNGAAVSIIAEFAEGACRRYHDAGDIIRQFETAKASLAAPPR